MEDKILKLKEHDEVEDEWCIHSQELNEKSLGIHFRVGNLDECPEDAIIGRDLFTAEDYVHALNKGIELAKKGYTKVEIEEVIKDAE